MPETIDYPPSYGEQHYDAERRRGLDSRGRPQSILPRLNRQRTKQKVSDILTSAFMGMGRGIEASSQVNRLGDPLLSALAGIGGAVGAPSPQQIGASREASLAQAQLAQMAAVPFEEIAPGAAEKYGLQGVPLGVAEKLIPVLERSEFMEQRLILMQQQLEDRKTGREESRADKATAREFAAENKLVGAEAGVKISLAQDAKRNIADIRAALAVPRARDLILKAGGSWKKLASLGDPDAEILANAIFQVADAEARIKTGAAINEKEVEQYFDALVPKAGTLQGTLDRIKRKESFFDSLESGLSFGRRMPGGGAGAPKKIGRFNVEVDR